tara:strand:+ start:183 stop:3209 length:3027 start_codon:yes stop_codon:yes gene_type:complete
MSQSNNMNVIKRNGLKQKVSFDKIMYRIQNLSNDLNINVIRVAQQVIAQVCDNINTTKLDELSAEICISMSSENLDYGKLASRISISNNHKNTSPSFSEAMSILYNNYNEITKSNKPLISENTYKIIMNNKDKLNSVIKYERDFDFNFFAFKTLERAYLMKKDGKIIERIQHLFMRVSLGIHGNDISSAIKSYDLMSQKYFIHATPTLYQSGTPHNQMASCFLMGTEDSVGGIYKTLTDCAHISKVAGGIGIHISNIRGKGSYISGTNGYSSGIIPMAKVYNETAKYINQSGRRPGSFALYLEPHHTDIMDFLELKKNHGNEGERARDLFLALWISDLFMKRVKKDEMWSLFNEHDCPGLTDKYGEEYEELYEKYEKEGKAMNTIEARKVWEAITNSQIETGVPYILYKDHINRKSNQKNVGTIKSSNLCVSGETMILTDKGYIEIQTLQNKNINVWNGEEFSKTIVRKTAENQELLKIDFSNGYTIKCTPYHNFYINLNNETIKMEAQYLKYNMSIIDYKIPIFDDNENKENKENIKCINIKNIKIKNIAKLEKREDTYCFTEKKLGRGIFNGILTGNCAEIVEYSDDKEYAVCTLASIGLSKYVEEYDYSLIKNVIIYSKDDCKYCKYTKEYLNKLGVNYTELKITDENNREELVNKIGDDFKTVPQIFVTTDKEYHVGGFNDIIGYFKTTFNFDKLREVMNVVVRNLNKIIDINYYPVKETEVSNKRHRPMGIGVQGLADVFAKMRIPFDSQEALKLNTHIFETMYFSAMECSHQLAIEEGPYSTFKGSPLSEGKFQFDLWGVSPEMDYDWDELRKKIMKDGVRNSLCIALMPTASTSQILGNNECFEPCTSNIYLRSTIAGNFTVINEHLIRNLMELHLWDNNMKDKLVYYNGSIQYIDEIPEKVKMIYKTVWELKQKSLIDLAIARAPFICQTQSMNLYFEEPTQKTLSSALFYGWQKGLKTGSYYIRSRPKIQAQQFSLDINKIKEFKDKETKYDVCESCSG